MKSCAAREPSTHLPSGLSVAPSQQLHGGGVGAMRPCAAREFSMRVPDGISDEPPQQLHGGGVDAARSCAQMEPSTQLPNSFRVRESAPSFTEDECFDVPAVGVAESLLAGSPQRSAPSPSLHGLLGVAAKVQPQENDRHYILLEAQQQKAHVDQSMHEQLAKIDRDFRSKVAAIEHEAAQQLQASKRQVESQKAERLAKLARDQPVSSPTLQRLSEERRQLVEAASRAISTRVEAEKASSASWQAAAVIERRGHDALARLRLGGPRPGLMLMGSPGPLMPELQGH